ncbi:MAG: flagellin, partial [Spirochaetae bacterium HGW-Spirochaetae-6]
SASENMQAAESRIRDTDMAGQMVEYAKNNILIQSTVSMLSQANNKNQAVLQLLR